MILYKINSKIIYICILLLFLSVHTFVSAIEINKNDLSVTIDQEVRMKIEKQGYAHVIILSKEKRDLRSEITSRLSNTQFSIIHNLNGTVWISGIITRDGLNKIKESNLNITIIAPTPLHLLLVQSVSLINADDVWPIQINLKNITGEGETVCVLDSGIDSSHPDLSNKILDEHCFCTGYERPACCPESLNESDNASDDNGHGTHVAGIASANGLVKGVGLNTNIVAVKIANSSGDIISDDLLSGIEWCISHKDYYNISVITMSFGSSIMYNNSSLCDEYSEDITQAIDNATYENIFVVVSSGNINNINGISWPSCISNATSVGTIYDKDPFNENWSVCTDAFIAEIDDIACLTNRAEILDLLAPGFEINSTVPNGSCEKCSNSGYNSSSGTSMSAPHVAGAAALLMQYEKLKNSRTLTPAEIRNRLKDTGKLITDNGTYSTPSNVSNLTFPRIDVYAAIFPIDTKDLLLINTSETRTVSMFKIQNNFNNKTRNVTWSMNMDDGSQLTGIENITLSKNETAFIFVEHQYSANDTYEILANATSDDLSDSETIPIALGNLIVNGLENIRLDSTEAAFRFNILNNMNSSMNSTNWSLNTGQSAISSAEEINMAANSRAMVFVSYNYTASGTYNVTSNATSGVYADSSRTVNINVPS
jgi:serine protease AprX